MERTYYAVVMQYDCDPKKNPPGSELGASGPILLERTLDNESALSEEATREIAKRWEAEGTHGWCRVAKVTVDIPEGE